jgi:hypothetical protein
VKISKTEPVVISNADLKKKIDGFFARKNQLDQKVLEETNGVEDLMELITSRSLSNGYVRQITEKIQKIVDQEKNPIVLWDYLKNPTRLAVYPQLKETINHISNVAVVLINSVSKKFIPGWFLDLLSHPEKIPSGFIDLFYKRVELLDESLGQSNDQENCRRTGE